MFLVLGLLCHADVASAASTFDAKDWQAHYESRMDGDTHAGGFLTLKADQNGLRLVLRRSEHLYKEQLFNASGKLLAQIVYNGEHVVIEAKDGHVGNLTSDQKHEFVSESALMTNNVLDSVAIDRGAVHGMSDLEKVHLIVKNGAPTDLWIDRSTGSVKMTFIILSHHVVSFRPLVLGKTETGQQFIAVWQRDKEAPMEITSVTAGVE